MTARLALATLLHREPGEGVARTGFKQDGGAGCKQGLERGVKADGEHSLAGPVAGTDGLLGSDPGAGDA